MLRLDKRYTIQFHSYHKLVCVCVCVPCNLTRGDILRRLLDKHESVSSSVSAHVQIKRTFWGIKTFPRKFVVSQTIVCVCVRSRVCERESEKQGACSGLYLKWQNFGGKEGQSGVDLHWFGRTFPCHTCNHESRWHRILWIKCEKEQQVDLI